MSAISGIYHRDGSSVKKTDIINMNDSLSHRGPDASNVYCKESIAFGHQMLCTTPESINENLPFEDENRDFIITSDARIDNRLELSEILNLNDQKDVPDSLFILKAYEKWGEKCPEKLLGDFAFAIWDKKKEQLFCARDHFGVKPFYYSLTKEIFLFGTEPKSILVNPHLSKEINKTKIAFFLKNFIDKKTTFYKNISILPPAHYLIIKSSELIERKYWELNPNLQIKLNSDQEYFDRFLEIFTEAVSCRLRSTKNFGFDLSGGLDSSSIVCTAKKVLKERYDDLDSLNTFSYVFDKLTDCDERMYIQNVIDNGGIKPNFVNCDSLSPLGLLSTALECEDQPYKNPFLCMRMNLYEKMSKNGLNIILSGVGGDIIVSHGQRYLLELAIRFKWLKLLEEAKYLSKRKNTNLFYEIFVNVIYPSLPEHMKNLRCIFKKFTCENSDFLNQTLENELDMDNKIQEIESQIKKFKNSKSAKYYHYYLINMSSNQNFLEEIDSAAAYYNIEPRYPFYDKRLIEYCYAIPTEMKFKSGWDRFVLRCAMEGILPPEIQWRASKVNFTSFLRKNLILLEKENLNSLFLTKTTSSYVDINKIKKVYSLYKNNCTIQYMDIYKLWFVAVLLTWLKTNHNNDEK